MVGLDTNILARFYFARRAARLKTQPPVKVPTV